MSDEDKANAIDKVVKRVRKQVKSEIGPIGTPDMGYVKSKDAPQGVGETITTYTKSLVTDPGQTIKAVLDGNPIRKVSGDTVILERKKGLAGDTDPKTERDHKIALTLGGTNDASNLQYLTKEENRAKAKVDTYLYNLMKDGKITRKEAQKRDLNWREELENLPIKTQQELVKELADISKDKQAEVIEYEMDGKIKSVKKTISLPKLTSNNELNKKILSDYKSDISDYVDYIMYQYKNGLISEEKAGEALDNVKAIQKWISNETKSPSSKKAKKVNISAISQKTLKLLR
jgi:hypothetical protein